MRITLDNTLRRVLDGILAAKSELRVAIALMKHGAGSSPEELARILDCLDQCATEISEFAKTEGK